MLQHIINMVYDKSIDTRKQAVVSLNRLLGAGLGNCPEALQVITGNVFDNLQI